MPHIHHLPDDRKIDVSGDQTILDASLAAGVPLTHACGGQARCSTCRVMVIEGLENCSSRTPQEEQLSRHLGFDCSVRLACQTRVAGDVRVRRLILDCEDESLAREAVQSASDVSSGEEKDIAILFADLAGFTAFSESLPPYDVIHTLNRYYRHVGEIVARNHGVINSYAGDGFMALFGLENEADAPLDAVRAGVGILQAVDRLKGYLVPLYGCGFSVRVGAHYGPVVLGALGSCDNRHVTVIGDAVNFASRVEAANKITGTRFLVSREIRDRVAGRVESRPLPALDIPGKSGKYDLFEVLGER